MAKKTVEASLALDVREFARKGCLSPGSRGRHCWQQGSSRVGEILWEAGDESLHLSYSLLGAPAGGPTHFSYPLDLARTPTRFEGEQVWFLCPGCQARVRKLYLPPGATTFACRACHELTYRSRQKRRAPWEKALARLGELASKLDDPALSSRRWLEAYEESEELLATLVKTDILADLPKWIPSDPSKNPAPASAPAKRSRGRPKTTRPYARRRPLLTSERTSESEAYCVKCRDWREPADALVVTLSNGRPARQGTCPVCQIQMTAIIKGPSGAPPGS